MMTTIKDMVHAPVSPRMVMNADEFGTLKTDDNKIDSGL